MRAVALVCGYFNSIAWLGGRQLIADSVHVQKSPWITTVMDFGEIPFQSISAPVRPMLRE